MILSSNKNLTTQNNLSNTTTSPRTSALSAPATMTAITPDQTTSIPTNTVNSLKYLDEEIKYYMEFYIANYSRDDLITVGPLSYTSDVITLPLPMNLVNQMSVDYQEESSSMIGQLLYGGEALPNMTDNIVTKSAAVAAGAFSNLTSAKAAGYAPNQWMVVLLKGPKYKTFEFSWKLSPKNKNESIRLRNIIKKLNESMSPNLSEFGNALFSFPKIFNIAFSPNHQYLYRFKPAVLNNFVVNYAGGGMPMFYGKTGAPESVELRMSFIEIEYWLGSDFTDDSNKFGGRTATPSNPNNVTYGAPEPPETNNSGYTTPGIGGNASGPSG